MGYHIRDLLRYSNLPVYSFFHEEALEGDSAQRAFTLLTLLCDGEDRAALRWWLARGSQTGLRGSYQKLRRHCESSGDSPRVALDAIQENRIVLTGIGPLLPKYEELKEALSSLSQVELPELIDQLFPPEDGALAGLREVATLALEDSTDLPSLFDQVRSNITQPEVPEGDFVRIMSLHKSKGLTSRVTIITGCSQGLIPFEPIELEKEPPDQRLFREQEQRRLFYVAITRCTETLVVSSFARVAHTVAKQLNVRVVNSTKAVGSTIASQFISELGPAAPASRSGQDWLSANYA